MRYERSPNLKTQTSDVFPAAFARELLGAPSHLRPEHGQLEHGCRVADGRRSSRPWLARCCQPHVRDARRGEAGSQAGCYPWEQAEQQRWRLGSIPRLAGQKSCAGTREGVCWKAAAANYSQPRREGGEEMCSFPGLCLHPGVTLLPAILSASNAQRLELPPGDFQANGVVCELLH